MSWFKRDSSLRSSFGRRSPSKTKPLDPEACLMSFKKHYQQACVIINKTRPNVQTEASNHHQPTNPSSDDVNVVLSNLDQMVTLLIQESKTGMSVDGDGLQIGPMLDYLMTEGILDRLYSWSLHCGEYCNVMKHEQLKLYEVLLSNSGHEILVHKPILRPLLKLLASCKDCAPVDVEKRLIVLLNQLCVSLTQNTNLLEYFFSASNDQGPARFLIFSLLIPFVHREGGIGQQARDALLLCMSLSHKSESIGFYIAEQSNFCPVLATGLSGLYSRLPRKLDIIPEDWCRLSNDDIQEIPELLMFMNSLEFCNAVIQVSHQKVKEQLLEYLYQGFLLPVLGPALHQNSVEEIETATAYLDLFVRSVTEPALMHSFLKFILTETFDGHVVIDSLIARINSHPRLSLITMSLFKTLLDINSEDVMLELVFKYLIPCNHVMVSQRCRVRDKDIYSHTTLKFLSLIPACCDLGTVNGTAITSSPSQTLNRSIHTSQSDYTLQTDYSKTRSGSISSISTSDSDNSLSRINEFKNQETFASHYLNYLRDARFCVKKCLIGCQSWSGKYDGHVCVGR
ncbi:FAM160A1 (predicted) [Pycnogonum litorale]